MPISTGFTPETTMGEHASLMQKKHQQQGQIKSMLNAQMQKRLDMEEMEKKRRIESEIVLNEENKQGLEVLKEKKKKEKEMEKMLMHEELQRVQSLKLQKVAG